MWEWQRICPTPIEKSPLSHVKEFEIYHEVPDGTFRALKGEKY